MVQKKAWKAQRMNGSDADGEAKVGRLLSYTLATTLSSYQIQERSECTHDPSSDLFAGVVYISYKRKEKHNGLCSMGQAECSEILALAYRINPGCGRIEKRWKARGRMQRGGHRRRPVGDGGTEIVRDRAQTPQREKL